MTASHTDPYQLARDAAAAIAEASGVPSHDLALVLGAPFEFVGVEVFRLLGVLTVVGVCLFRRHHHVVQVWSIVWCHG